MEVENYYKAMRKSLCGRGITAWTANFASLALIVSIHKHETIEKEVD